MTEKELKEKYPVETYSRIVGYLSNVSGWNKGKREEFEDRQEYTKLKG